MKPRPGAVRFRLAHSTVLLAVCLLVGSRLAYLFPLRPAVDPVDASAFAAADQLRDTAVAGRLGRSEEHWSAPRSDVLKEQAAERHASGLANLASVEPAHPVDELAKAEQQQQGLAVQQQIDMPPPEQAQRPHAQAADGAEQSQAEDRQPAPVQQHQKHQQQQQQQEKEQRQEQLQQQQQSQAAELPTDQQSARSAADAQAAQGQRLGVTVEGNQQQQQVQAQQAQQQAQQRSSLRCAVINNVSTHLDVAAGLAWALQEAGCKVTCYLHHATQGIQDVMSQWYRGQFRPMGAVLQDVQQYDILVVATMSLPPAVASLGLKEIMLGQRHLPPPPHQRVALVVHNPDHLLVGLPLWLPGMLLSQAVQLGRAPALAGAANVAGRAQHAAAVMQQRRAQDGGNGRRLAAAAGKAAGPAPPLPPRLQLLALSPNVATYTSSLVEAWAGRVLGASTQPRVPVPWLPPLVPWQSTAAEHAAAAAGQAAAAADPHTAVVGLGAGGPNRPMRHLCIQGAIDPRRRDYDSFFEAASHPAVLAQLRARNERLLLVGHKPRDGLPPMPQHLHGYVEVAADLIYETYYNTLASCRAILTAFGSDSYVLNKTSSTIAAAIHLEVPLLTEERVLRAYPFLNHAAAFVYDSGLAAPNVAKLARAAARRGTPAVLARAISMSIAAEAAGRRRLQSEGAAEEAAAAAAEEQAEDAEVADAEARADDGEASQPNRRSDSSAAEQQEGQQPTQAYQQQPLQPASQIDPAYRQAAADFAAPSAAEVERPPLGSYAAALLAAFDDDAVRLARRAARELKAQLMRHNLQVAEALLADTASAAAALAS